MIINDQIKSEIRKYLEQNYQELLSDSNVASIYELYDSMACCVGLNVPDIVEYWIGNE